MTIMIAPKIADIIETIINVKAHPNSPAVSVTNRTDMIDIKLGK